MSWTCPYCNQPQVVSDASSTSGELALAAGYKGEERVVLTAISIRCLNVACKQRTLAVSVNEWLWEGGRVSAGALIRKWHLLPDSSAKPQPPYIPAPLVEDYREACQIADLSPKAAATLARRCLQGMIRDFCGISKNRLIDEIKELRRLEAEERLPRGVQAETIDAIDAIRAVGNIGAHMEKDINLIVDVDAGEARTLIELIELLFSEWYVARHRRQTGLNKVIQIAADKKDQLEVQKMLSAAEPKAST